jgi:hypothetical protein
MVTIVLDTILGIMVIGMVATMAGMGAPMPVTVGITQVPVMQVMVGAAPIVVLVALALWDIVPVGIVVADMLDIAEAEAILVARC